MGWTGIIDILNMELAVMVYSCKYELHTSLVTMEIKDERNSVIFVDLKLRKEGSSETMQVEVGMIDIVTLLMFHCW